MKKKLEELGLTEEQIKSILEMTKDTVSKDEFQEIKTKNERLEANLKQRDEQINKLKETPEANEELKKQINELQSKNKETEENYKKEMLKFKKDIELKRILTENKAKNPKALMPFLDLDNMILSEDGKLIGIEEQLTKIKETEAYLFDFDEVKPSNPKIQSIKAKKEEKVDPFEKFLEEEKSKMSNKDISEVQVIK